jgi:hypothetical protein
MPPMTTHQPDRIVALILNTSLPKQSTFLYTLLLIHYTNPQSALLLERYSQRCQVDVIRMRKLVGLHGTIHTLIQVDGCAAGADGHQCSWGKWCARRRGGSSISHGLRSNKREHLMKQWPVKDQKAVSELVGRSRGCSMGSCCLMQMGEVLTSCVGPGDDVA